MRICHVGEWIEHLLGRVTAQAVSIPAGRAQIAKIGIWLAGASFFGKGRNRRLSGVRSLVTHGVLVAEEELGGVSFGNARDDDRPADRAAKLVAVEGIRRGSEEIPRVEVAVAQELKRVAMKTVGRRTW